MSFSLEHDVSEEILDFIVSLCSREDLISLCRCSRKFSRIATAYLYSEVYLRGDEAGNGPMNWILPFAYLMFTSATHASAVRSFTITGGWCETEPREYLPDDWCDDDKRPWPGAGTATWKETLMKVCTTWTMDEDEAALRYDQIENGHNEGAILALLVASFPNLQRLDVRAGIFTTSMREVLERAAACAKAHGNIQSDEHSCTPNIQPALQRPNSFSQPLDVMIAKVDQSQPPDPHEFAVFLNLPNLRSLYGWEVEDIGDPLRGDVFSNLNSRSCPVEHIECRNCSVLPDDVKGWLDVAIPGKLKTFVYEYRASDSVGYGWVEHKDIMRSLQPHYATLQGLGLSNEEDWPYNDLPNADITPVSCKCFETLKQLKVSPVYIFGMAVFGGGDFIAASTRELLWEALPSTLEELWVTRARGDGCVVSESLEFVPTCLLPALNLLVQHHDSYPLLQQFRIDVLITWWELEWLEQLASCCHSAETNGIKCTIMVFDKAPSSTPPEHIASLPERGWGWNEDVKWSPYAWQNQERLRKRIVVSEEHDVLKTLDGERESAVEYLSE